MPRPRCVCVPEPSAATLPVLFHFFFFFRLIRLLLAPCFASVLVLTLFFCCLLSHLFAQAPSVSAVRFSAEHSPPRESVRLTFKRSHRRRSRKNKKSTRAFAPLKQTAQHLSTRCPGSNNDRVCRCRHWALHLRLFPEQIARGAFRRAVHGNSGLLIRDGPLTPFLFGRRRPSILIV